MSHLVQWISRRSPATLLLTSVFLFSIVFSSVKLLSHLPVSQVVFFRSGVSFLLTAVAIRKRKLRFLGQNRKIVIYRGLFGTCALLLYFYTLQNIPFATAATTQYLNPIFTVILAGFFHKEYPRPLQWVCFVTAFFGVLLVRDIDTSVSLSMVAVGVLSAFFSGLAYNFIRASEGKEDPLVVMFALPLISLPIILPHALLNWVRLSGAELLILITMGFFTQAAQYCMTVAYQRDRAANISGINYLGIVFAAAIGWFFFGEAVTALAGLGIVVVILSILISSRLIPADSRK